MRTGVGRGRLLVLVCFLRIDKVLRSTGAHSPEDETAVLAILDVFRKLEDVILDELVEAPGKIIAAYENLTLAGIIDIVCGKGADWPSRLDGQDAGGGADLRVHGAVRAPGWRSSS
jgi:hypothetical protein